MFNVPLMQVVHYSQQLAYWSAGLKGARES